MQTEYRWDNFDYGLIDSPFRAPLENANGGYQNGSFGVDTRTEPGCVLLGHENASNFVTNSKPLCMVDLTRFGGTGYRVFTENGQVYDESGTIIHTLIGTTDEKKVLSATCLRDATGLKIFMFSPYKIHTSNANFTSVSMGAGTFTVGDTKRHTFAQVTDAAILVGSRNIVYSIDYVGAVTQKYKLPEGESVTGMTLFQDLLTVYAANRVENTDDITGSGFQYMFQVASSATSWTYRQEWPGLPVAAAATIGGTDYVITGASRFYSDLYQVNGTQKRLLRSNTEGIGAKRCFLPAICTRIDDAYVGCEINELSSKTVLRLGSYYPGMPTALTPEFGLDKEIFAIGTHSDRYIVTMGMNFVNSNIVRLYDVSNTPEYNRSDAGEIISPIWNAGTNEYERTISEIKVNLDAYGANNSAKGTIKVYARKNRKNADSSQWVLLGTKTVDSTQPNGEVYEWTITKAEMQSANFGNFRQIEFKVRLEGGAATSDTPIFRGLVARIEDGQKK